MAEEKRRAPRLLPLPKHRHRNQRAEPRRTRRVRARRRPENLPGLPLLVRVGLLGGLPPRAVQPGRLGRVERQEPHTAYPVLIEGEGRVLLAGEHLSYLTGWQAGAIESAWQQIAKIHERASA